MDAGASREVFESGETLGGLDIAVHAERRGRADARARRDYSARQIVHLQKYRLQEQQMSKRDIECAIESFERWGEEFLDVGVHGLPPIISQLEDKVLAKVTSSLNQRSQQTSSPKATGNNSKNSKNSTSPEGGSENNRNSTPGDNSDGTTMFGALPLDEEEKREHIKAARMAVSAKEG